MGTKHLGQHLSLILFDNDDHWVDNEHLHCCNGCTFKTGWNHDLRDDVAKIKMEGKC